MSVTFAAQLVESDILGYTVACKVNPASSTTVLTYEDATATQAAHEQDCPECSCTGTYLEPVWASADHVEVNVTNFHARELLDILGIERDGDLCGSMDPADFLGRVLIALAVTPADEGTLSRPMDQFDVPEWGTATDGSVAVARAEVILCGRPAGYLQDRLVELVQVAQHAQALGRDVDWA